MQKTFELLSKSILFQNINITKLTQLLKISPSDIRKFKKNDIIFNVDDKINFIGIILSGKIQMNIIMENGKSILVSLKMQGDVFGIGCDFPSKNITTSNALFKEDTKILFIGRDIYFKLILKNDIILKNYLTNNSKQMLFFYKKIELLSYSRIEERIAFYLLYMQKNENDKITLPFSKKDWAEYINVSRSSFFRELKKMSEKNIFEVKNSIIKIINKKALKNIISSGL